MIESYNYSVGKNKLIELELELASCPILYAPLKIRSE